MSFLETSSSVSVALGFIQAHMCVPPQYTGCVTLIVLSNKVKMGKDHTIYATTPGFVRFYKEPLGSGERKYVGVVLKRDEKLPRNEALHGRSRYSHLVNLTELLKQSVISS
jgi:hypothetical protein